MFVCDRTRVVNIGVDYSDQLAICSSGIFVCMPFAEMTYTDDSNPEQSRLECFRHSDET